MISEQKLINPEYHALGTYSTVRGAGSSETCALLELKAASRDGHIDTANGTYFVRFDFWKASDGTYANVEYNTHGFREVFAKIKPLLNGIAGVLEGNLVKISKDITASQLELCVADLENQTAMLGTITELPPRDSLSSRH
jgi:hypothetical protein